MDVSVDTTLNTESIVLFGIICMVVIAFFVLLNSYAKKRLA